MFKRTFLAASLGLFFAVLSSAEAAVQTYNFSGMLDSGYYVGEHFSGSFSFSDVALVDIGEEWLVVDSLSMNILGNTYTLANADAPVEVGYINGSFLGLSYSVSSGEPQFSFIPGLSDVSEAYVAYDTPSGLSGAGDVMYAPVPEPKDWLLILAGLGLVGVMVERVKRRV